MTYADLAELASIPSPQRIHKLTQHLEARIARDAQRGVPIIASVVVSKRAAGLPGDGFFDCCAAHGISQQEGESAGAFHQRLLGQVFRGAGGGARSAGGAFADDEAGAGA